MTDTLRPRNWCRDCGHAWYPRGNNLSVRCPECRSERVGIVIPDYPPPPLPPPRQPVSVGAVFAGVAIFILVALAGLGYLVSLSLPSSRQKPPPVADAKDTGKDAQPAPAPKKEDGPPLLSPLELQKRRHELEDKLVRVRGVAELAAVPRTQACLLVFMDQAGKQVGVAFTDQALVDASLLKARVMVEVEVEGSNSILGGTDGPGFQKDGFWVHTTRIRSITKAASDPPAKSREQVEAEREAAVAAAAAEAVAKARAKEEAEERAREAARKQVLAAIPEHIADLADKRRRTDAVAELAKIGEPAVEALTAALGSPDKEVRRCAAMALGHMGAPAAKAIPALQKMGADDVAAVRDAADTAIKRIEKAK